MSHQQRFKLNAAGKLAVIVSGVVIVGLLALGGRAVLGSGNRLRPVAPPSTTLDGEPVAFSPPAATAGAAHPDVDYDAAWETFLEVIYRCDALPDRGDDLGQYPQVSEFDALPDGIERLTSDAAWIGWCEQQRPGKRLAQFGPRNLDCSGATCTATVAVHAQGGLGNYAGALFVARPPLYQDVAPLRLLQGVIELQEEQWVVTKMAVEVLPPSAPLPDGGD